MEKLADKTVKINLVPLTTIWYADETVFLSDSIEGFHELWNSVNTIGKRFGFHISVGKTKFIIFSPTTYNNITW